MIHVGALANLALQKFKAGTISIWQRRGSRLVLGSVWCGVLAASLPHRTHASGTTGKALLPAKCHIQPQGSATTQL